MSARHVTAAPPAKPPRPLIVPRLALTLPTDPSSPHPPSTAFPRRKYGAGVVKNPFPTSALSRTHTYSKNPRPVDPHRGDGEKCPIRDTFADLIVVGTKAPLASRPSTVCLGGRQQGDVTHAPRDTPSREYSSRDSTAMMSSIRKSSSRDTIPTLLTSSSDGAAPTMIGAKFCNERTRIGRGKGTASKGGQPPAVKPHGRTTPCKPVIGAWTSNASPVCLSNNNCRRTRRVRPRQRPPRPVACHCCQRCWAYEPYNLSVTQGGKNQRGRTLGGTTIQGAPTAESAPYWWGHCTNCLRTAGAGLEEPHGAEGGGAGVEETAFVPPMCDCGVELRPAPSGWTTLDDVWPRSSDPNASADARARRLLQLVTKFSEIRDRAHTTTKGLRVYHGARHLHERLNVPCGSAANASAYAE